MTTTQVTVIETLFPYTNEMLQAHLISGKRTEFPDLNYVSRECAKSIRCADGFTVSLQASNFHYCSPREIDCHEYYEIEIGFPSEAEELWMEYAENKDEPTGTVYGYVPVELVLEVLNRHGGVVVSESSTDRVGAFE